MGISSSNAENYPHTGAGIQEKEAPSKPKGQELLKV
jgi:hypothetical protein